MGWHDWQRAAPTRSDALPFAGASALAITTHGDITARDHMARLCTTRLDESEALRRAAVDAGALPHGRGRRNVRPMANIIGLTGGIACGKSTVAARLAARGARIVDADAVARDIVRPGAPALAEIIAAVGAEVCDATGALDRAALGRRVFGDAEARARLERITHPRIAEESARRLVEAAAGEPPLVVYDAALLFESGRAALFRPIVVVTTTEDLQRERLMRRDGLDTASAHARITAQMPLAEKVARADYCVHNDGSPDALDAQLDVLWPLLTAPHDPELSP